MLGRHACLGRDVINLTNNHYRIFNIQKGRVDFLLSNIEGGNKPIRTTEIAKFLNRKDIIPIFRQQEYCQNLPKYPPKYVYMDSFSELVDQLFTHRATGWNGCCCYSDIDHTEEFRKIFTDDGLLDIDKLESSYRNFFNFIKAKYGDVPIIFLHFPMALEVRGKFLERGRAILKIIDNLSNEYSRLYSISIDETVVSSSNEMADELKNFPYHYNKETYKTFANLVNTAFYEINNESKWL